MNDNNPSNQQTSLPQTFFTTAASPLAQLGAFYVVGGDGQQHALVPATSTPWTGATAPANSAATLHSDFNQQQQQQQQQQHQHQHHHQQQHHQHHQNHQNHQEHHHKHQQQLSQNLAAARLALSQERQQIEQQQQLLLTSMQQPSAEQQNQHENSRWRQLLSQYANGGNSAAGAIHMVNNHPHIQLATGANGATTLVPLQFGNAPPPAVAGAPTTATLKQHQSQEHRSSGGTKHTSDVNEDRGRERTSGTHKMDASAGNGSAGRHRDRNKHSSATGTGATSSTAPSKQRADQQAKHSRRSNSPIDLTGPPVKRSKSSKESSSLSRSTSHYSEDKTGKGPSKSVSKKSLSHHPSRHQTVRDKEELSSNSSKRKGNTQSSSGSSVQAANVANTAFPDHREKRSDPSKIRKEEEGSSTSSGAAAAAAGGGSNKVAPPAPVQSTHDVVKNFLMVFRGEADATEVFPSVTEMTPQHIQQMISQMRAYVAQEQELETTNKTKKNDSAENQKDMSSTNSSNSSNGQADNKTKDNLLATVNTLKAFNCDLMKEVQDLKKRVVDLRAQLRVSTFLEVYDYKTELEEMQRSHEKALREHMRASIHALRAVQRSRGSNSSSGNNNNNNNIRSDKES